MDWLFAISVNLITAIGTIVSIVIGFKKNNKATIEDAVNRERRLTKLDVKVDNLEKAHGEITVDLKEYKEEISRQFESQSAKIGVIQETVLKILNKI